MKKRFSTHLPEIKRIMLVAMLGSISACLQIVIFNILRNHVLPELASAIAIELAIINNFFLNHRFSFSSHSKHLPCFIRFAKFNGVACGSLLIQVIVLSLGVRLWGRGIWIENALVLTGMGLGFVTNYLGYRFIVWR